MSLEMAHKVIVPPTKNYIPQFLKQRDINSYFSTRDHRFPLATPAGTANQRQCFHYIVPMFTAFLWQPQRGSKSKTTFQFSLVPVITDSLWQHQREQQINDNVSII
jgi:hypothetical protein